MGLFSSVGDFLTGSDSQSLGRTANESIVNVTTPGASSSFDPGSNTVTSKLDPRHQEFQDLLFNLGKGMLGQIQGQDFNDLAQQQFDTLSDIGRDERELQRQSLENRLFNKGLLGTTAGANMFREFQDSQSEQSLQRELAAREFANRERNSLFNLGLNSLSGIQSLDQTALAPISLGSRVGNTRAGLLANQRLQSQDIGSGLLSAGLGAATGFFGGGSGGGLFG